MVVRKSVHIDLHSGSGTSAILATAHIFQEIWNNQSKMNADQLSIDFANRRVEYLIGELERSGNQIAISLTITTRIIGSSLNYIVWCLATFVV